MKPASTTRSALKDAVSTASAAVPGVPVGVVGDPAGERRDSGGGRPVQRRATRPVGADGGHPVRLGVRVVQQRLQQGAGTRRQHDDVLRRTAVPLAGVARESPETSLIGRARVSERGGSAVGRAGRVQGSGNAVAADPFRCRGITGRSDRSTVGRARRRLSGTTRTVSQEPDRPCGPDRAPSPVAHAVDPNTVGNNVLLKGWHAAMTEFMGQQSSGQPGRHRHRSRTGRTWVIVAVVVAIAAAAGLTWFVRSQQTSDAAGSPPAQQRTAATTASGAALGRLGPGRSGGRLGRVRRCPAAR